MEDIVRSQLRVPFALHEQLRQSAERSGRSLNAEIIYRLSESLKSIPSVQSSVNPKVDDLVGRLSNPAHQDELRTLLDTLYRLTSEDMGKGK